MKYKQLTMDRNADGSYTVCVDGKNYQVQNMTELIHFLNADGYENVKEADSANDSG